MIYRQNFTFYQKKTGFTCFPKHAVGVLFVIGLLLSAPFSLANAQTPLAFTPVDTIFPTGRLVTEDGAGFAVSDYHQKAGVMINFWASWCAPCIKELPELVEASHKLAQSGIIVVLVNVDRKGQTHALSFLAERDISLTGVVSAFNPEADWPRALKLRGLPSTFFHSKDGQETHVIFGPEPWADETVIDQIVSLIGPADHDG